MDPTFPAVAEVEPAQALVLQRSGAPLVDVREPGEWALGSPPGAHRIPLARVHEVPGLAGVPAEGPLLLICASGRRSVLAAQQLAAAGCRDVRSVAGGVNRWRAEGLPIEHVSLLDQDSRERYSRHLLLPEFGEAGQLALARGRVVVIGAGGLGSPALYYLAAAGVGHLRVVDFDRVDRSNLQRQILHRDDAVGEPKVHSAARALGALNPRIRIEPIEARIEAANVESLLGDADVVLDGSDNFAARYVVNDACVKLRKPLVYGAVHRFEGQVGVFWPAQSGAAGPCYRCLFPLPPPPEAAPNCAEAGVLGVVPGLVGLLQANEVIKLLTGIGTPLVGRLLGFDALGARFREVRLPRDPGCPACAHPDAIVLSDHAAACAAQAPGA